jgi:hypothetical protein
VTVPIVISDIHVARAGHTVHFLISPPYLSKGVLIKVIVVIDMKGL